MPRVNQKITKEALTREIGAKNLALVLNNVYCVGCDPTAMIEYENDIVVEQSDDAILRGN